MSEEARAREFGTLFDQHYGNAYRVALRLLGEPHTAEDVVSDAFAKVWLQWTRGRVDNFPAYLRRTVVNRSNSLFRRRAIERRWLASQRGAEPGQRSMDQQAVDADVFKHALMRLTMRQRTAVVLRYYEDASERDMANAMGCSVDTAKTHLHRGMKRLAELMTESEPKHDDVAEGTVAG